jgi:hypothetical protein
LVNIPLFSGKGASEIRPEVIGRIKNLQIFNGSPVASKERNDSEKVYLRKILRQKYLTEQEGTYSAEQFENEHPNYQELFQKYSEELTSHNAHSSSSGPQSLASDLITITINNLVFSTGNGNMEPTEKKVPSTLTVDRLRLMIKQIFGVEPKAQNLSIQLDRNSMPIIMDDDSATIRYYGALDGSKIYVNEV